MISARRLVVVAALAALGAAAGGRAATPQAMPHHHQVEALYVIDHLGKSPRGDADLVPYSRPFQKILGGCSIGVDDLTNMTIHLSDQASTVGGRNVTSLQMLQSIARRVTWNAPRKVCRLIYDLAEGHREAGDP